MMKQRYIAILLAACLTSTAAPFASASESSGEQTSAGYETISLSNGFLSVEAEDPRIERKDSFEIVPNASSFGGAYVMSSNGYGVFTDPSEVKDYGLGFHLTAPEKDVYSVWLYARADYWASDEIYYATNNDIYDVKLLSTKKQWYWIRLANISLEQGDNLFKLAYKEGLFMIDKVVITNNLSYKPEGDASAAPEIRPGEEQLLFNLPPVAPTVGQHPRLLVTEEDLPKVRENLEHPENIEMWKFVQEIAALDTDGTLAPTAPYRNTNEQDKYVGCAEANAFLYLVNGTEENGRKAITVAKNYLKTLNIKTGADDITRHTGYAIYVAACAYDWCYDLLTEDDKKEFRVQMLRHAERMEISWPPTEQHFVTGHGCEAETFRDALSMGIALYDEDPEVYNLIAGRIFQEMITARNYAYGAQLFTEGTDYGPFRYPYEVLSTIMFDKLGLKEVYTRDQLHVLYGTMYDRLPDGRFLNTGDCSSSSSIGFYNNASDSYFLAGNYYKDPYIRKLFFKSKPSAQNVAVGRYGVTAPMHLILNDPSVGVADADGLPLTAYFDDPLGTMIAKTSWEEGKSSNAMMVKMNAGARTFLNHQHLDSGHFDIYYKGKLALDSGMYKSAPFSIDGVPVTALSYGSNHDKNYHKRTIAHNCMLVYDPNEIINYNNSTVNDGGQKGGGGDIPYTYEELMQPEYEQGKATNYNFGPDAYKPAYSYLKGDLASAYTEKVEDYDRTFLFLNFFDEDYPGALIVFDNIKSSDSSFKKTWLLHSQEEPQIEGNTTTVKRTEWGYNGRMINTTLLPSNAVLSKVGGAGHEFDVNGANQLAVPPTQWQDSGKWRLEVSPGSSEQQDYFLNVIQVSENNDAIAPMEAELIQQDEDYVGVKIKDRAVFLRKPKMKMYRDFSVKAEGEGDIMYIVNGLKAGRWNVTKDGQMVASDTVTEEKDSICFTAPAGEYQLSWQFEENLKEKDLNYINNMRKNETNPYDIKIGIYFETFQHKPFEEDNILFLDAEEYFNKLQFDYQIAGDQISVTVKNVTTILEKNSDTARITDAQGKQKEVKLEAAVTERDGRLYMPIERIASSISTKVRWVNYAKCAFIEKVGIPSEEDKSRIFNPQDDSRVNIAMVTWSSQNDSEDGFCSVDGNLNTYWAASGTDEWIQLEFDQVSDVSKVELYWNSGNKRKERFEMLVSIDGKEWTKVFDGESDGVTDGFETVMLPKTMEAKYLKIVGHGNSINNWNSLKEIYIYK